MPRRKRPIMLVLNPKSIAANMLELQLEEPPMPIASNRFRLAMLAAMFISSPLLAAEPNYTFDPPLGSGKLILSEDFESTAVGQIPKGFTKSGAVGVVDNMSHSGTNPWHGSRRQRGAADHGQGRRDHRPGRPALGAALFQSPTAHPHARLAPGISRSSTRRSSPAPQPARWRPKMASRYACSTP